MSDWEDSDEEAGKQKAQVALQEYLNNSGRGGGARGRGGRGSYSGGPPSGPPRGPPTGPPRGNKILPYYFDTMSVMAEPHL